MPHDTAPHPTHQPTDRGSPVIRTIAMPADTNPAGDIFGGRLMGQMDPAPATSRPGARGAAAPPSQPRR